ncbi:hypothetical protein VNO78_33718 [Psophocarpus tetragonolobus]|uniref:Uncharacterized protein n=1 Tax=Psophocarpus tetragonolobus TaxID=3891 RepID=A0AAN9P4G7_PSOTE
MQTPITNPNIGSLEEQNSSNRATLFTSLTRPCLFQQHNPPNNNIHPVLMKKFYPSTVALFHNLSVILKILPFIGGLIASYKFVDVTGFFLNCLVDSLGQNNRHIALVVTNLLGGLSSLLFVIVSQISEEYTADSAFGAVWAALVLLALGKGGQKLSEKFLEYQLKDYVDRVYIRISLFVPSFVVYIMTIYAAFHEDLTYGSRFRFATFLMLGAYVLFLVGSMLYSEEELSDESNLGKIYRTFKAAIGKRKLKYPTSPNFYYWKGYKQGHWYSRGKGLRLLPHVPRLFRWLDKAAIVSNGSDEESPEIQLTNGKLCTVKEVREVKSLVPMIYLSFTLFGYSFLLASEDTFFVSQASNVESVMSNINGNDIYILILIKEVANDMSRFILLILCTLVRLRVINFMQRKEATIIRVGFGMFCAVICCLIARQVEISGKDKITTVALVPQFIFLGVAQVKLSLFETMMCCNVSVHLKGTTVRFDMCSLASFLNDSVLKKQNCSAYDLWWLDLSNNPFSSGSLPDFSWFSSLTILYLRNANIVGPLSFDHFPNLLDLDLSFNNLNGRLTKLELTKLTSLERSIHLNNNNFFGEVPSLSLCKGLIVIDFGDNILEGTLPTSIGDNLPQLIVLGLRANKIQGSVPTSLCHLSFLQVLDLSSNEITGKIPQCLNHMSALSNKKLQSRTTLYGIIPAFSPSYWIITFVDDVILACKGKTREYGNILKLMIMIDLSDNHLTGEIPQSITTLTALISLNLSNNNLTGFIPCNIGHMERKRWALWPTTHNSMSLGCDLTKWRS